MREPWNPWQLAVLALFGGPLAAGYLYGENFRRLGRRPLFAWCVIGALALTVAIAVVAGELVRRGVLGAEHGQELRFGARGATMLAILPLTYAQQRRFRIFTVSGGEPGALWRSGFLAVVVGGFAAAGIVAVVMPWMT